MMGHNSELPDLDVLPSSVQDIAETLGIRIVFKLVSHFGGVELRIPHKLKPDHKLMVLGLEDAEALCQFCPAETILVPITLDRRRLAKQVNQLASRGFKRWEIARELKISQRHVRRLANGEPQNTNQIDMFG